MESKIPEIKYTVINHRIFDVRSTTEWRDEARTKTHDIMRSMLLSVIVTMSP